jgi:hypothetical protein
MLNVRVSITVIQNVRTIKEIIYINLTQYKNDVIPVVYRNSFIYQIKIMIKKIINTTNYDDYLI